MCAIGVSFYHSHLSFVMHFTFTIASKFSCTHALRLVLKKAIVQTWIVAHACGLKFYSDSIYYDLLGYNWRQLVENDDLIMHIAQNLQVCMCTVKFKQLGDICTLITTMIFLTFF